MEHLVVIIICNLFDIYQHLLFISEIDQLMYTFESSVLKLLVDGLAEPSIPKGILRDEGWTLT